MTDRPNPVKELIKELTYKEGWKFEVVPPFYDYGHELLKVTVTTVDPKTKHPVDVTHRRPIPPTIWPADFWSRWLLDQIIDIETHEACEFFKLGDRRPFYPH